MFQRKEQNKTLVVGGGDPNEVEISNYLTKKVQRNGHKDGH